MSRPFVREWNHRVLIVSAIVRLLRAGSWKYLAVFSLFATFSSSALAVAVALRLNRIFRTFGAGLRCLRDIPRQHPGFEKFETGTSVHLPFDRLEAVNVSLDWAVAPRRRD